MSSPEMTSVARRGPELLAPAGDWECARAAVENGADGIYFGLERFNARMRARNFTVADLPELMAWLHRRGVKGYVTFNTLVFADELKEATEFLRAIITAGVDAAIVQDVGIARLIRSLSPDFPMHASTQMTVTSAAGVEFMGELGFERVILARECPVSEIAKIREASRGPRAESREAQAHGDAGPFSTLVSRSSTVELEVFVHGALCVAYSGQCLTSESLGGRSANRGECAQACRMPYELIADGKPVPLGDRRYLLSPQDLAALEVLPDLVRAGVCSVKIEGRLKAPEYVAAITRVYRQAIDQLSSEFRVPGSELPAAPGRTRNPELETRNNAYDMEMAFSRGLYTGWLRGINNQKLVHARFGKKRGVYLGEISHVQGERVFLRLEGPLKPGDGVVFDAGRPDQPEEGGRVYEVRDQKSEDRRQKTEDRGQRPVVRGPRSVVGSEVMVAFGHGDIDFTRVQVGDKLWKTSDPELDRRVRQTFRGDQPQFHRAICVEVHGHAGAPLTLAARDESGHVVQLDSTMALSVAESQPLTTERLRDQLGRLGGTPFRLGELENHLAGPVILPVSELNRLRRELVAKLEELCAQPTRWTLREESQNADCRMQMAESGSAVGDRQLAIKDAGAGESEAELAVLVRDFHQFDAALDADVRTLYCEFEDPKKYREAVNRFRVWQMRRAVVEETAAAGRRTAQSAIFVAPPRISKMGEEWILKQIRSANADGYLLRNYDHLKFFTDGRRIGDFSLNVANPLAADYFIHRHKLERVTASYDLNSVQLEALLQAAPPEWFEITIHQHMPMFHMEHCVFCAFLSQGTDYTNCGRPCDQHQVELRDRVGAQHPVKADAGCRNTVFNARAQTGAEFVARFLALGARRFRVEFLNESADTVTRAIEKYRRLLRGEITGSQLWHELKLANRLGVTRGPMERAESKLPKWGEIEW
ncbi:MAG: U32 family peptidase [Verrucomicrobia bacterium]|nr:U32 family peptidase [Verrucomicrobiota bacterium]